MELDVADLVTIVYGSSYFLIVLYLSVYCWIRLEKELILSISKITIDYKKIASTATSKALPHVTPIVRSPSDSPIGYPVFESYQFSFQQTANNHIQEHMRTNALSIGNSKLSQSDLATAHSTFLRPIPDRYYEKFIKPFDIFADEENDQIASNNIQQSNHSIISIPNTPRTQMKDEKIALSVKFFYWVWVTWNMSSIYGLLIIHIWDIGTDLAIMVKWYRDGKNASPQWESSNGDIDLLALFIMSILFILLYRVIASLMIYSLTQSPLRVLSQLVFDFEIYRAIFISFKLKLSEPGYIQTWLQKLEATFESLPQAVLQISYVARIANWNEEEDSTVVITSILLSLVTMAERFERDDKLYFPYSS